MRLRVFLPARILVNEVVRKVSAEAQNGSFTLLPRHIDFVTVLTPGLLSFETEDGDETFLAVAEGVLVKRESEVNVSVRNATRGKDLQRLRETVREEYRQLDELEKRALAALTDLETDMIRRLIELGD